MKQIQKRTILGSLELVQPHLSPLLVPEQGLNRIRNVAGLWPVEAVEFFGFECRLGPEVQPADCALNLTATGARMLAAGNRQSGPAELCGDPWTRIAKFYQQWGATRNPPFADATCTWLEFDASQVEVPAPNLLFGYWPDVTDAHRPIEWLLDVAIPGLLGQPLSPAFRSNLQLCFDSHPTGTRDFQIGVMLSRSVQAVRLCVFDLTRENVAGYLERIGWRGPRDLALEYMDAFAPNADFIGLHLDVGEAVFPHVGIEPNFKASRWARQPHREPRWQGQFDTLMRRGLLVEEKKEALLNWTGHRVIKSDERKIALLRGLSHLKVVLRPNGDAIAKAYIGIAESALEGEQ